MVKDLVSTKARAWLMVGTGLMVLSGVFGLPVESLGYIALGFAIYLS